MNRNQAVQTAEHEIRKRKGTLPHSFVHREPSPHLGIGQCGNGQYTVTTEPLDGRRWWTMEQFMYEFGDTAP